MKNFFRFIRRMVLRWELRQLDEQARAITLARQSALQRLRTIRTAQACHRIELGIDSRHGGSQ